VNKEKNIIEIYYGQNKKLSLKEFKQLKFELKCIENYIENYFEIPFMKNNIKYKK
jgi:hypothetical protein